MPEPQWHAATRLDALRQLRREGYAVIDRAEYEWLRNQRDRLAKALASCWDEYEELMPDALRDGVKAALGIREFTAVLADDGLPAEPEFHDGNPEDFTGGTDG